MFDQEKVHRCSENKEAICRRKTCEKFGFDPRSFCHNICAKTKHVCGQTTCEKLISREKSGNKVVCMPKPKCKIIRHFGPEIESEEKITGKDKSEGKDEQKGKNRGKNDKESALNAVEKGHSENDGTRDVDRKEEGDESSAAEKNAQQHHIKSILEKLSETIDSEGMAAIYALAGSEICPCCECKICECKLRNVTSKTLLDGKKRALIVRKLKKKGIKQDLGDLGDLGDMGDLNDLEDKEDLGDSGDLQDFERNSDDLENFGDQKNLEDQTKLGDQKDSADQKLGDQKNMGDLKNLEDLKKLGDPENFENFLQNLENMDNEEDLVKNFGDLENLEKLENLTGDQKKKIRKLKKKKAEQFGYAFDYFYQPDLEAFEAERRSKQEKERQEEVEREKLAEEQAEHERRIKEAEAVALEQASTKEEEVQAEPETQERLSQFYGKEQKQDLITAHGEVPIIKDKIEDWQEKVEKAPSWTEYKAAEWAGVRHQDVPSVIEVKTAEAMDKSSLHLERPSQSSRISTRQQTPPFLAQKPPLPQIDLQLHAFDKSWLEDPEKLSLVPASIGKKESKVPDEFQVKKIEKPVQAYSTGPVLRAETTDIKPEMIPLMHLKSKKPPTAAETMEAMGSMLSGEEKESIISETASEESSITSTEEDQSRKPAKKKIFLTDVCHCLPGYCTCGMQHYAFRKDTETEDFGIGFKTLQVDKMIPSTKEERKRIREMLGQKTSDISVKSSCSCFHSEAESHVTPVVSQVEVVAVPPTTSVSQPQMERVRGLVKCTRPKYQKTLVIVKPEAVRFKDVIMRAIQREGLDVLDERLVQLTPEQVAEIYTENFGSAYFPMFVQQLSSSPILVIAIAGNDAIQRWNKLVGPEKKIPVSWFYPASMRKRFSVHEDIFDVMKTSDDFHKAKIEIRYFFPLHIIDPIIISSSMVQDYCDEFIHPTLLKGLLKLVKQKPSDPIGFLAEWLLVNNPFQPFYKQIHVSLAPQ